MEDKLHLLKDGPQPQTSEIFKYTNACTYIFIHIKQIHIAADISANISAYICANTSADISADIFAAIPAAISAGMSADISADMHL